jgi:hypothetical protein
VIWAECALTSAFLILLRPLGIAADFDQTKRLALKDSGRPKSVRCRPGRGAKWSKLAVKRTQERSSSTPLRSVACALWCAENAIHLQHRRQAVNTSVNTRPPVGSLTPKPADPDATRLRSLLAGESAKQAKTPKVSTPGAPVQGERVKSSARGVTAAVGEVQPDVSYSAVPRDLKPVSTKAQIDGVNVEVYAYPNDRINPQGQRQWSVRHTGPLISGDSNSAPRSRSYVTTVYSTGQLDASIGRDGSTVRTAMAADVQRLGTDYRGNSPAKETRRYYIPDPSTGNVVGVDFKTWPSKPDAFLGIGSKEKVYTFDNKGNRVEMKYDEQREVAESMYAEGKLPEADIAFRASRIEQQSGTPEILVRKFPYTEVTAPNTPTASDLKNALESMGVVVVNDRRRNESTVYLPNTKAGGAAWEAAQSISGYAVKPLEGRSADFDTGAKNVADGNRLGAGMNFVQTLLDLAPLATAVRSRQAGRRARSGVNASTNPSETTRSLLQMPVFNAFANRAQAGGGAITPGGSGGGGRITGRRFGSASNSDDGVRGGSGGGGGRGPRRAGSPDPGDAFGGNNPNNLRIFSTPRGAGWGVSNLRSGDKFESPNRPVVHGDPQLNQRYSEFFNTRLSSRTTIFVQRPAGLQMFADRTEAAVNPNRLRMDSARQNTEEDGVWNRVTRTVSTMADPASGQMITGTETVTQRASINPVLQVTDVRGLRQDTAWQSTYVNTPSLRSAGAVVVPQNAAANQVQVALPGGEIISIGRLAERQSRGDMRSLQIESSQFGSGAVLPSGTRIFYPADSINNAPAVTIRVP